MPGATLVPLEKEPDIARHQTGHNSGVIHAGIYYAPGSLKATLCREGANATKRFCTENGIPFGGPAASFSWPPAMPKCAGWTAWKRGPGKMGSNIPASPSRA